MALQSRERLSSGLAGVAGEYLVAAELSLRGYLATLTPKNTKGVDILVSNIAATEVVAIQVKTVQGSLRDWPLNAAAEKLSAPRLFYVFVNLGGPSGTPEYHIVNSKTVAQYITRGHRKWLKTPGKDGRPHRDNPMRKFRIRSDEYINNWSLLGLD